MNKQRRIILIPLMLLFSIGLSGQTDENQIVPIDSRIKMGKLENGLTYYIMSNKEPEERASFYIIQNVGSLLEEDNQNGLAHFLEHMAFNGTEHFPDKGIINTLEKHGVAFGRNINAYTYYYETVYNLSDVPIEKPGLIDTCLLVLNDWSNYLLLTSDEIDAERGVIIEEWRTRRTSGSRMMEKIMPVLLKDSKYPERDIIGDREIIKNFEYNTLRDFYHKWYRTDLQAIAIVGDIDVEEVEMKVIDLFSKIPKVVDPEPLPNYNIPEHQETRFVVARDKEASQNSIDLYIKIKAADPLSKGKDYLREQYIRTLFNSMMSVRIGELLQKGTPPFVTGTVRYGSYLRGYDIFSVGASSRPNEDSLAFDAIYREAERVRRWGFTQGELERMKSNLLTSWESYYKQRDKVANDSYASNIQAHFLENEPLNSIEFEYQNIKEVLPTITLEEVSGRAKLWMTKENRVIIVQGPESENSTYLSEEQALSIINSINDSAVEPYADEVSGEGLISEPLEGGKVVSTKILDQFNAVEWTLQNGVEVVYKHADFEKDEVAITAYSPGGISLVEDQYMPEAEMLAGLAASYGVGEFDNVALQKVLTGKTASVSFSLGGLAEVINGSSTPKDFETLLQMLYLKFEKPRFDMESHDALMSRYEAFVAQMNNNPQKVMQDSVSLILSDYHPRTRVMDASFISDVEFKEVERIYRERFTDADDFTFFIVGNIDKESTRNLVERYIGSLKSTEGSELWIDRKINQPLGRTEKSIKMELAVPKATILIRYSNELNYTPYNRQAIRVIKGILDLRYTETIREEEGGTYGVSTSLSSTKYPVEKVNAAISFECEPSRARDLKDLVYLELEKLQKEGPSQEDLEKTVNNMLKNREESKKHNSYWLSVIYSYYYNGIDNNNPSNYEEIIKGFTVSDIKKVAELIFKDADVIDLIFEPKED